MVAKHGKLQRSPFTTQKLRFVNHCLRQILKIFWPERISNHQLREICYEELCKQALGWNPQGKRKRPHLKHTCWKKKKEAGMTWSEIKKAAQDR
ncbi:unnamed protein product [Pieris macdunnoughi]|uniref:Uncharacterized protein n=1 Tax=Pieris macdunnoughi TaxID=345717 RepID=A0A821TDE4_9NEOP|nr:unnamed protein product [Pieris macdunnoughi]